MDDWDQLAEVGDAGALLDLPPLALWPASIVELAWDAAQATLDLMTDWIGLDRVTLDRS